MVARSTGVVTVDTLATKIVPKSDADPAVAETTEILVYNTGLLSLLLLTFLVTTFLWHQKPLHGCTETRFFGTLCLNEVVCSLLTVFLCGAIVGMLTHAHAQSMKREN